MATPAQRKDLSPAEQARQDEFDFLVPFSDRRPMLTIAEVAKILDRERDFVEAMIDEGRLEAFAPPAREVQRKRITRRSVLLLLAEMSLVSPRLFLDRLLRCVDVCDAAACSALIQRATARRMKL